MMMKLWTQQRSQRSITNVAHIDVQCNGSEVSQWVYPLDISNLQKLQTQQGFTGVDAQSM